MMEQMHTKHLTNLPEMRNQHKDLLLWKLTHDYETSGTKDTQLPGRRGVVFVFLAGSVVRVALAYTYCSHKENTEGLSLFLIKKNKEGFFFILYGGALGLGGGWSFSYFHIVGIFRLASPYDRCEYKENREGLSLFLLEI